MIHKYLKKIKHNKNLINPLTIENISSKISTSQKLRIVDGEYFIHYESDSEFVNILQSVKNECVDYIQEQYSTTCTIQSIYLLEINKNHETNFNYYNGNYLIAQKDNTFKYLNMTNCDVACVVFLNKSKSTINFKLLSMTIDHTIGDILVYPLTQSYINSLIPSEECQYILLMHAKTSSSIISDDNINQVINSMIPKERTHGYTLNNIYYPKFEYNHGLLAAMTSILYKISMYKGLLENINTSTSPGLDFYKKGYSLDKDIYPYLFKVNNDLIPNYSHNTLLSHADISEMWKLNSEQLFMIRPYIDKYFSPSQRVLDKVEYYKTKYNIYPNNTIAVYFRGTDRYIHKFEHDVATKPLLITEKLKEIQEKNPNLIILLQSDDLTAITSISKNVKNCISISEPNFKPSDDGYPIHYGSLDRKELAIICYYCVEGNNRSSLFEDGIQHAIDYIAFLILASQCKFIVTHTGHGPLWMLLYRNSLENFIHV